MGVMELIAFIESSFNVEFTDDDLTVENFQTIEAILSVIMSKAGEDQ
jgi:acyl carrier protein